MSKQALVISLDDYERLEDWLKEADKGNSPYALEQARAIVKKVGEEAIRAREQHDAMVAMLNQIDREFSPTGYGGYSG